MGRRRRRNIELRGMGLAPREVASSYNALIHPALLGSLRRGNEDRMQPEHGQECWGLKQQSDMH